MPRVSPLPQDSVYIFREGALPPYRQMFYQLCDLNVEEYVLEGREAGWGRGKGSGGEPAGTQSSLRRLIPISRPLSDSGAAWRAPVRSRGAWQGAGLHCPRVGS